MQKMCITLHTCTCSYMCIKHVQDCVPTGLCTTGLDIMAEIVSQAYICRLHYKLQRVHTCTYMDLHTQCMCMYMCISEGNSRWSMNLLRWSCRMWSLPSSSSELHSLQKHPTCTCTCACTCECCCEWMHMPQWSDRAPSSSSWRPWCWFPGGCPVLFSFSQLISWIRWCLWIHALVKVATINDALVQEAATCTSSALVQFGYCHWCFSTGGCYHQCSSTGDCYHQCSTTGGCYHS